MPLDSDGDVIVDLTARFAQMEINVRPDWLAKAVRACRQSRAPGDLFESVLRQLIFVDRLQDSVVPKKRPPASAHRFVLTTPTLFEIVSVVDVGQSAHSQIRQLEHREEFEEEDEDDPTVRFSLATEKKNRKRQLLVELSDGRDDRLRAFEFNQWTQFPETESLRSGQKIFVMNGVECRRGVLMCSAAQIMMVGGGSEFYGRPSAQLDDLRQRREAAATPTPAPWKAKEQTQLDNSLRRKVLTARMEENRNKDKAQPLVFSNGLAAVPSGSSVTDSNANYNAPTRAAVTSCRKSGAIVQVVREPNEAAKQMLNKSCHKSCETDEKEERKAVAPPPPWKTIDSSRNSDNATENWMEHIGKTPHAPLGRQWKFALQRKHSLTPPVDCASLPETRDKEESTLVVHEQAPDIVRRFQMLRIVTLAEIQKARHFWMHPTRRTVMPLFSIVPECPKATGAGDQWAVSIKLTDATAADFVVDVSHAILLRLFGVTVAQAKERIKNPVEMKLLRDHCMAALQRFQRLDLVYQLEIDPNPERNPVVVDVDTLAHTLGLA